MTLLFHLISLAWLGYVVYALVRQRSRSLLDPLFHAALGHLIYFSTPPTSGITPLVVLFLVSGTLIATGYLLVAPRDLRRRPSGAPGEPLLVVIDRYGVQMALLVTALGIAVLVPVMAMAQGISLFKVLTSFYTLEGLPQVNPVFRAVYTAAGKVGLIVLIVGRIWFHTTGHPTTRVLWNVLFAIQFALAIASGVRAQIAYMLLYPLLADLFVTQVLGVRLSVLERVRQRTAYSVVALCIAIAVPFMTLYRTARFNSFSDVSTALQETLDPRQYKQAFGESARQNLNDILVFVLDNYSRNPQYLEGVRAQLLNPVPRFLWPDKPRSTGKMIAEDMLGRPPEDPLSLIAGIGGEGFYNLGWIGAAVFSLLFGLFFGWLARAVSRWRDTGYVACALLFVAWTTGITRGDWVTTVNYLTYQAIVFWLLLVALRGAIGRPITYDVSDPVGQPG